ncbi:MAG: MFS transporter [Candidatus Hodarchaeales archaeon]|jgi:GPH family glycoside/pentoside/hexuronide:cation symporter
MAEKELFTATSFQKFTYSIATFGNAMLGAVVTVFTLFYYKEVVYETNFYVANEIIILPLLGSALAIGWWVQALMNPVAGWLSDKVVFSRFGRRKPWLILGSPIIAISFIAIFLVPTSQSEVFFPIIVCVYLSIMPEICPSPEERTSISTYRQGFYLIGYILGALIGALVEDLAAAVSIILAIFFVICFYIAAFGIKEQKEIPEVPTFGIIESLRVTFRNKPFLPYLGYTIFMTAYQSMLITMLPIFGRHVVYKGIVTIISSFLPGAFVITGIIAIAPAMYWINKVGKKKAALSSMIIIAIITCFLPVVGFVPGFELPITLLVVLMLGFPAAPLLILPDSIISDITDYDEMVTGTRREAMHFASQGLLTRFASGVAIQMMGIILGVFGATYSATAPINSILGLILIGPIAAICAIIGVFIFRKYPEEEVLAASAKKLAR